MTAAELPCGDAPKALYFSHFPTLFQAVIWRNWNLVEPAVLARVLHTDESQIRRSAADLGLEFHPEQLPLWKKRGYQTVIRRNWELLDYEQLLELLEWTPEQLLFTLKEDDFLFYKLGLSKPVCPKVFFRELTDEEKVKTQKICKIVKAELSQAPLSDPPFNFLVNYGKRKPLSGKRSDAGLKMIYSYSALYGDPLMDDDLDSYPEGLLADYAACGVNAIWIQATLYTLVPWLGEDQAVSQNWQKRQRNLKRLVERTAKYGIEVILYMNEPRSMPAAFFAGHPDWKGASDENGDNFALCTSNAEVRESLSEAVERLFRDIPGLGGMFSITMSENLTHCKSRGGSCPRCENRSAAELAADVNNILSRAMHKAAPKAKMIAYSWAWQTEWLDEVIAKLDPDIMIMSVSETDMPTVCLGHPGKISDYSVSRPGPGECALRVWKKALAHGAAAVAKVQFNCSWEMSPVPYIPVPDLIEEHIANLKQAGVHDLMLSWTLGGYPGGNLELLCMDRKSLAEQKFGKDAASTVLSAWNIFSKAFHEYFPFNECATIYFAPQNFGPMNLLFAKPTNRAASMIGFPFDDIETWRGARGNAAAAPLENPYPPELLERAFQLLSEQWKTGLDLLKGLHLSGDAALELEDLVNVAETVYCHFRTACLQIRWVSHRMDKAILSEERSLAQTLFRLVRKDSRLGYEASNHYLYTENDLLEKILNCDELIS